MKVISGILVVVKLYIYVVALLIFNSVNGDMDGNFHYGKYKLAYILTVVKNMGPKMCVLQCARIPDCNGINYEQAGLYCELLLVTADDDLIDKPGFKYAAISDWKIDNDVCYPNPCRPMQKCVITYNNLPVCVKIKDSKRTDCMSIKTNSKASRDGVYKLEKDGNEYLQCDMTTDKGGWTVIQKRFDGSVNFNKGWSEYKTGFGDRNGEFWIGNDKLHAMTSNRSYKLRIDLERFNGTKGYAVYSTFKIENEASGYKLNFSGYSGNAGNSLHEGSFKCGAYVCSPYNFGCWWYGCLSHLNGRYYSVYSSTYSGIYWKSFSSTISLKKSKMMIQPIV